MRNDGGTRQVKRRSFLTPKKVWMYASLGSPDIARIHTVSRSIDPTGPGPPQTAPSCWIDSAVRVHVLSPFLMCVLWGAGSGSGLGSAPPLAADTQMRRQNVFVDCMGRWLGVAQRCPWSITHSIHSQVFASPNAPGLYGIPVYRNHESAV